MEYSWFIIFLLLFFVLYIEKKRRKKLFMKQYLKKKRKNGKENEKMKKLAQSFIGKECIIYLFETQLSGVIKEVSDGALLIEQKGEQQAVNLDFVTRIREYPKNKSGKRKSLVID